MLTFNFESSIFLHFQRGDPLNRKNGENFGIFYQVNFLQITFLGKYKLFLENEIWYQPNNLARYTWLHF